MPDNRRRVSIIGVIMALLIPVAVAGLAAILHAEAGPHEVSLIGVPSDALQSLEAAPEGEATVSQEEAIEIARAGLRGTSTGQVRDIALGRYTEDAVESLRGRLVWVVSFVPDELAPVFVSGGIGRDTSCDWAFHYKFVIVEVDAETGEWNSTGNGAFFDPSLPPTYDSPKNSDRAYCEALLAREREVASSP